MDSAASWILLLCIICSILHLLSSTSRRRRRPHTLPPGPYPFPIIGNILQLCQNPHQSLTKLSKTYGPLMHFKLGPRHTIIVSSPEIARQVLQKHDHAFPSRTTTAATEALLHHQSSVACLPVGSKWRILRKICREQMFSTQRLDASRGLRRGKLQKLLDYVEECSVNRRVIDIGEAAFVTSLNLISNTLFSVDFADYNTGSSQELKEIIHGLMRVMGSFNFADYFPILKMFDPQGIQRDAEFYTGKLLKIFDDIIDERLKLSGDYPRKNDLLEALLEISRGNQAELSREDIKHLLLDLFVAGTDTTSGTVEWVMTELLRNPTTMSKAKKELQTIIGPNKKVEESDISKLPYLQAVIKETFRYHPPGPFLVRRKDEEDLKIDAWTVPRNAIILINIWAIGRDSRIWPNPDSFEPERFLNNGEIDIKGHHFELIPFGSGRRMCPGLPLAHRMVHLMVAYLVRNFDWKFEAQEVDLNEKFGLSLQKAMPLRAMPMKLRPLLFSS